MTRHEKFSTRIFSVALSVAMVCTLLPSTVFAAEETPTGMDSIAECHPLHDETCGYIEAVEDAPCRHSCSLCRAKDGDSNEAEQQACSCEIQCFPGDPEQALAAVFNPDCPVCGSENSDLEQCRGSVPVPDAVPLSSSTMNDFSSLTSAISSAGTGTAENPTVIEIGAGFDLTAAITISGKHVKLTSASGGPYTLTRASSFTGILFSVAGGGSLTLDHITLDGNKDNVSSAGVLVDVNSSKLTLEAGTVLQNNKNSAIEMYKANASVTMNGGLITGNAVAGNGGAVRLTNSAAMRFMMNGGEISGNTVTGNGSAISDGGWDANPTIIITGGEIKDNTASGAYGGAIYSNCTLQISGGTISGNAAPNGKSGGIYKTSSGAFTMTGGTVKENSAGTEASKNGYMLSGSSITLTAGGSATILDGFILDAKSSGAKYINVSSALSGQIAFTINASTAVKTGDVAVKGSGYTLTEADKTHLSYTGGAFGFKLDTAGNQIMLATPDGVPEKDSTKSRIYARGAALILAAGSSNANYTVIYLDKNSNGTIDEGDVIWAPPGMDTTAAGNNLPAFDIIGGSYREDLTGTTKITMLGGNVKSIFAGGSSGKITGNTAVSVLGGTVGGSVYGGGLYGSVTGNTSVTISGSAVVEADVFGGGQGDEQDSAVSGSTNVSITGGKVRMVYGGGAYKTDTAASTTISISGGEITEDVFGGGFGAAVSGQTTISVTGGRVDGSIYGSTNQAGTVGSSDIAVTGGTVGKSVYPQYLSATVSGEKKITIGGAAEIGTASGPYIYGVCFNGGSATNGVTSVVIAPDLSDGASVNINLPSGFHAAAAPLIATEAVAGDAAKLHLVGTGAEGLETYFDGVDNTVKVRFSSAVSRVTVAPNRWIIRPGMTKQFTATIDGTGTPAQTVTWAVSGNNDAGTTIDNTGSLSVAPSETAGALTVTAISTADTTKSGTAAVTLQHLTGIRVTTPPTKVTYAEGESFDRAGMAVWADFVENSGEEAEVHQVITDYITSPGGPLSAGDTKVAVSYTVGSVTKTAEVAIMVNAERYTITISGGGTGAAATPGSCAAGTTVTLTAGTRSGYTFTGWTSSEVAISGTNFVMPAKNVTVTANWSENSGGSSGGGGSSGDSGSGSSSAPGSSVIVDGKTESIGKVETSGSTTTVVVDSAKLDSKVSSAKDGSSVVIPVSTTKDSAAAQLVVESVEKMAAKDMTLEVKSGKTTYTLPAAAIDTDSVLSRLGATDAAKVLFTVTITNEKNVKVEGATVVGTPMSFTVTAAYNGKSITVDRFDAMLARTMEITKEQAGKVTTAVVVDADGTVRHVPTSVCEQGGKWYAKISSMTNSTYALITNDSKFTDVSGKRYEAAASELSARKITDGVFCTAFEGEKNITRAEFAALLVNAFGLPKDGKADFSDAAADAWYSEGVATAVEYGIVKGLSDGTFAPDATITRQEAMVMIQRAASVVSYTGGGTDNGTFTDRAEVGAWAADGVAFSLTNGLIVGHDGKINPTGTITRAETATVLLRLLQKAELIDVRAEV